MSTKKDKFSSEDKRYMSAINLAKVRRGLTGDNPYGCVIVKNNETFQ